MASTPKGAVAGRFHGAAVLVAIAVVYLASETAAEQDVVMLEEGGGEMAPAQVPSYHKIPGFRMEQGATAVKAGSKGSCEGICNSQSTCKSFSYSRSEGKCLWSTSRMAYDPDFVFNCKPQRGTEYQQFPGLVFHQTGWLKSTGKTEKECAGLCNNAAACRSFSYRSRDKLCLLSGKAIGFHDEYTYYEKRGLGHRSFALHPKDKPAAPKKPKAAAKPAAPANAASEGAIKAALKAAMKAGAAQKTVIANGEPASVVAERLRAVKKWAEEKIVKKGEEEALKLKAAKLDAESKLEKQKSGSEKKEAAEKIQQNKSMADRAAARKQVKAKEKAEAMVAKVKATAKAATVAASLQQANQEKKQAQVTIEKAQKQVKGIKEVDSKKQLLLKKESLKKAKIRKAEEARLRMIKEKDRKANKKTTAVAVSDAESKITKQAMDKAKEVYAKTEERHEKTVAKEKARKKTRKLKTSLDMERAKKAKVLLKKKLAELSAVRAEDSKAKIRETVTKKKMKMQVEKAKAGLKAKVKMAKLAAKKKADEAKYKARITKRRANEQMRKKSRVKGDGEKAAKEGAAKTGNNKLHKKVQEKRLKCYNKEKEVAVKASKVQPAEKGVKMLEKAKKECRKEISKAQKVQPKATKFSVRVRSGDHASVNFVAPMGKAKESAMKDKQKKLHPHGHDLDVEAFLDEDGAPSKMDTAMNNGKANAADKKKSAESKHVVARVVLSPSASAAGILAKSAAAAKGAADASKKAAIDAEKAGGTGLAGKGDKTSPAAKKAAADALATVKKVAEDTAAKIQQKQAAQKGDAAKNAAELAEKAKATNEKGAKAAKEIIVKSKAEAKIIKEKANEASQKTRHYATTTKEGISRPDPWAIGKQASNTQRNSVPKTKEAGYKKDKAAQTRGYTAVMTGSRIQSGYFKFPIAAMKANEYLQGATLELAKQGGPKANFNVKLTKCDYKSSGLTFKSRPMALSAISGAATFPEANGPMKVTLDKTLIASYVKPKGKKPKTQLCIEITGGGKNAPVYINEVSVKLDVKREPGPVDTSARRRRTMPKIQIMRRRRTALGGARRRRSVQAVKDGAKELYKKQEARYKPQFVKEMNSKIPKNMQAMKLKITEGIRRKYQGVIQDAIKKDVELKYSKSATLAKEASMQEDKVNKAVAKLYPAKYKKEKVAIVEKAKADVKKRLTKTAIEDRDRKVNIEAKEKVNVMGDKAVENAIKAKVAQDLPAAVSKKVSGKAAKDSKKALDALVKNAVPGKVKIALAKVEAAQVKKKMAESEGAVAKIAAQKAVGNKIALLVKKRIEEEVTKTRMRGGADAAALAAGGSRAKTALTRIKNQVARNPIKMPAHEKKEIEQIAAQAAVKKLKVKVQAQVKADMKRQVASGLSKDITAKETKKLKPEVTARITKQLTQKYTAKVKPEIEAKARKQVVANKPALLKTIEVAVKTKLKAKLTPAMNKKLEKDIPAAIKKTSFLTEVKAAQAKLKETLKTKMKDEMMKPMEKAAKMKFNRRLTEGKKRIESQVRQQKMAEMQKVIAAQTKTELVEKEVKKEEEAKMEKALAKHVAEKTKAGVKRKLEGKLKKAVEKKYEKGTLKKAQAAIASGKAKDIKKRITAQAKKEVKAIVAKKLAAAKFTTLKKLEKTLTAKLYEMAKGKMNFGKKTKGMKAADAAAVKHQMLSAAKVKAASDAKVQADIEMKSKLAANLEKGLYAKEMAKMQKVIVAKVKAATAAAATELAKKTLAAKVKDDVKAMEKGHAHVQRVTRHEPKDGSSSPSVSRTGAKNGSSTRPSAKGAAANAAASSASIAKGVKDRHKAALKAKVGKKHGAKVAAAGKTAVAKAKSANAKKTAKLAKKTVAQAKKLIKKTKKKATKKLAKADKAKKSATKANAKAAKPVKVKAAKTKAAEKKAAAKVAAKKKDAKAVAADKKKANAASAAKKATKANAKAKDAKVKAKQAAKPKRI